MRKANKNLYLQRVQSEQSSESVRENSDKNLKCSESENERKKDKE